MAGMTPGGATPNYTPGMTPMGAMGMETPSASQIAARMNVPMTPEQYNTARWEREIEERNRPLTDHELDAIFPAEGYQILDPPASYVPIRTPARKLLATPTPGATPLYQLPEEDRGQTYDLPMGTALEGLPEMKPEDYQVCQRHLAKSAVIVNTTCMYDMTTRV
jgi:splicing factor 3B subunit 1